MPRMTFPLALVMTLFMAATVRADLEAQVRRAMEQAKLGDTAVAVSIRDTSDGTELVEISDTRGMMPASNMKLFTSGAALHVLGKEYSFRSVLARDDKTLWFIGGGDPGFGDPKLLKQTSWVDKNGVTHDEMEIELLLDQFVNAVVETGDRHFEEIVIDDRIFDRNFVHPDWPRDQLDKHYCAEVAGVNFGLNVLRIDARPRPDARPDISRLTPRMPWILPENKATGRKGKGQVTTIGVTRPSGSNKLTVYGNVIDPVSVEVTLSDMPSVFARLLYTRLQEAGIQVDRVRLAQPDDPMISENVALLKVRTPIHSVLRRCNTDSSNLHAESLLKVLGHTVELGPGSWENGSRAVRMAILERIGPEHVRPFRQADGSGLSRNNRVTAEMVTAWLCSFEDDEAIGPTFLESLADRYDSGSFRNRFNDLPGGISIEGKTGHIRGVSCLSGIVSAPDGRSFAFSVLCNEISPKIGTRRAKDFQNRVVDLLADRLMTEQTALGGD